LSLGLGATAIPVGLSNTAPRRARFTASIGTTIFGAFVAMGLLIAALGGYGLYVLQAAGGFVVELYDRPLMAINYDRAASLGFAEMDKEQLRQAAAATDRERAAIEAKIRHLAKVFNDDLAVAAARSLYDDEKAAIGQIHDLVARWNELRLVPGKASANDLETLAAGIMERFDLLAELATGHSFVLRRKVVSDVAFFEYTSAAALILALLLAGGITVVLVRRIVRPLRDAAAIADRIAEGELQAPIPEGVRDETGLLLRSMTVMQQNIRDMVEREQAQRRSAQNRLVEALENSREAVVLVDAEDRIVIANSRLADFFPTVAPQLASGMSFTEAFRQVEQLAGPPMAEAAAESTDAGLPSSERELRLADGRWLRISRSPLQEGGFEPRAAHPAQRHHRLLRCHGERGAGRAQPELCPIRARHPAERRTSARHHQQRLGSEQERGRQAHLDVLDRRSQRDHQGLGDDDARSVLARQTDPVRRAAARPDRGAGRSGEIAAGRP
jgi:HAMP domain-containing protein